MIVPYVLLAVHCAQAGLFAIGGGLATLPFFYELARSAAWFSAEEIPTMLAVVQLLPGGIGINMAASVGARLSPAGAYLAVLAMVTPQIITITLIARALESFENNPVARRVFAGLAPAAAGLLAAALFRILNFTGPREVFIIAAFFVLIRIFQKLHPAVFIAAGALLGILIG